MRANPTSDERNPVVREYSRLARSYEEAGHSHAEIERYRISWRWGLMTATAVNPG